MLPIFVDEGATDFVPIKSMPGVFRIPESKLESEIERYARAGIRSVMTFGISHHKDHVGTDTWQHDGLVARMASRIKKAAPEMVVMSDTCFCEYTTHGHCGVVHDGKVENDATLVNLGKQAVIAAQAGADVIAPSTAMDGLLTPGAAFNEKWKLFAENHWKTFGTGAFADIRPNGKGLGTLSNYLAHLLGPAIVGDEYVLETNGAGLLLAPGTA